MNNEAEISINSPNKHSFYFYNNYLIGLLTPEIIHESNNPLSIIQLSIDDINDYLHENDLMNDVLSRKILNHQNALNKIVTLFKNLKEFVKQDFETTQNYSINDLVKTCFNLIEPIFKKEEINIKLILNKENTHTITNAGIIQQVLLNTLINIRNYLNKNSGGNINIKTLIKSNNLLIRITYFGFDIIYSEYSESPETGFQISSSLLKDIGGKFNLIDYDNIITSFDIYIPLIQTEPVSSKDLYTNKPNNMTGKILFVDDEIDMLNIIKRYLTKLGFEVDTAINGKEAIKLLKTNTYRILITDLKMPGMSGEELLKSAKDQGLIDNTIILITTGGFVFDSLKIGNDDIDGYIQKPFSKDDIYKILNKVCN
ncbi:MAG: response regulator [Cyanobacteriota bacterium]